MKKINQQIKLRVNEFYSLVISKINSAFDRAELDFKKHKNGSILALVILSLIFIWLGFEKTFLLMIFLCFFFFQWEIKVVSFLGIFSILLSPLFLMLNYEEIAEKMSILAFYFFSMTLFLRAREIFCEKEIFSKVPEKISEGAVGQKINKSLLIKNIIRTSFVFRLDIIKKFKFLVNNFAISIKIRAVQLVKVFFNHNKNKKARIIFKPDKQESFFKQKISQEEMEIQKRKKEIIDIFINNVIMAGTIIKSRERQLRRKNENLF